jgi:hypothetical protein
MTTIEELESRVSKLEGKPGEKVFLKTILSPLLVVIIGGVLTWRVESGKSEISERIEQNKADIQRIELAQKMVPLLFGGNPQEAFATQRLL